MAALGAHKGRRYRAFARARSSADLFFKVRGFSVGLQRAADLTGC